MARKDSQFKFAVWVGALFLAIIGLGAQASSVQAAGVISTCSEAAFNTALSGGGDVIFTCSGTINITTQKIIAANTVINATGQNVILDGGSTYSIFTVNAGVSLTLRNLTIQNASGGTGSVVRMGNGGTLIIEDSQILNNQSTGNGGAITADVLADINGDPAIIQVRRSLFENNQAGGRGGAISIDGGESGINVGALIEIEDSTFRNNSTNIDGGAILANFHVILNSEGTLYANNSAQDDGGAINVVHPDGITNFSNNTFSFNSANLADEGAVGGALNIKNSSLVHNTFYGNSIGTAGARQGSAINWANTTLSVLLQDNIFSGNTGSTYECMRANTFAPYGSNNLTDDGSCNGGTTPNAVTNFDTTLQNNGGPTHTHSLSSGSNAIDASSSCTYASSGTNNIFTDGDPILRDQRGAARPFDADGNVDPVECDKGAYEVREMISWGDCITELSGTHDFLFSSGKTVSVAINSANGLSCISVEEMGGPHLLGNPGIQMTNNWWLITGDDISGFDINLTLPASFAPDSGDQVCHYGGTSWDCSANTFDEDSITRNNVSEFSDWATYEDQSPTAITLKGLHAYSDLSTINLFLASSFILVCGLVALRLLKKSQRKP